LKEKPPYFSPTLTDPQWLPEVHYEDVDRTYLSQEYGVGGVGSGGAGNVSVGGSAGGSGGAGFGRSVSFSDLAEGSGKHHSTTGGVSGVSAGGDNDTVMTEQSEVGMNVQSEYKVRTVCMRFVCWDLCIVPIGCAARDFDIILIFTY